MFGCFFVFNSWLNTLQYNYDSRSYLRCGVVRAHGKLVTLLRLLPAYGFTLALGWRLPLFMSCLDQWCRSDDGAHSEVWP